MKYLKRIAIGLLSIFLCVWFLSWVFSPMLARHTLNDVLASWNLHTTDASIVRYNFLTSSVDVTDLQLIQSGDPTFVLESLELKYRLTPLFAKKLVVDQLIISGIYAELRYQQNQLNIVGIDISNSESETSTEKTQPNEWQILVDNLLIQDSKLDVEYQEQKYGFDINKIHLSNLHVSNDKFKVSSVLDILQGKSNLQLESEVNLDIDSAGITGSASAKVHLRDFDPNSVAYFIRQYYPAERISGDISLGIDVHAEFEGVLKQISVPQITFDLKDMQLSDTALAFNSSLMHTHFENTHIQFVQGKPASAATTGRIRFLDGELQLAHTGDKVVDWSAVESKDIGVAWEQQDNNNFFDLNIPSLVTNQLDVSTVKRIEPDKNDSYLSSLFSAGAITIQDLKFSSDGLEIAKINLEKLQSDVALDAEKNLTTLVNFDQLKNQNSKQKEDQASSEDTQSFKFSIGEITLNNGYDISFADHSIKPALEKEINIEKLTLRAISNHMPSDKTHLDLALKDEYMTFAFAGDMQPFNPKLNLAGKGELKEFALADVATYINDAIGLNIRSGNLDSQFTVNVIDSEIDSEIELLLRGAKFSSKSETDEASLIGTTAIPLNVALDLIKNRKGDIKLTLPIKGNVDDPKFGVGDVVSLVIQKAAMKQAQSYLVKTFIPYGQVVNVALSAGSMALKIRFEDLTMTPSSLDYSNEQLVYIDGFIKLMQDKPKLRVNVCPSAVLSEIPVVDDRQLNELNWSELSLEQKQSQLLAFAKKRGELFKQYAVEKGGLDSARILLCAPKIEVKEDAEPKIKISV